MREQRGAADVDVVAHVDRAWSPARARRRARRRSDVGGRVALVHALDPLRERALVALRHEPVVQGADALAGEAVAVVELQRLPRLAELGVPLGVAGPLERQHADLVHPHVVGVRVDAVAA